MTEKEAIARLRQRRDTASKICGNGWGVKCFEDIDMAISAFEEVQQYREIGTVEECRVAVEKQKPKKPEYINGGISVCRERGHELKRCYVLCPDCGQAIQWKNLEGNGR